MAKIKTAIEDFRPDPRLVDERGPTPERASKLRPSPINLAIADDRLTRQHGLAAEKLYAHWHRGGLVDSIPSSDLDRVFGGDGFSLMARTENMAFHRDRFRKAEKAVTEACGHISFWVTVQIVCHEKPFVEVGQIFGHKNRNRAAKVALDILIPALNKLCTEWGVM